MNLVNATKEWALHAVKRRPKVGRALKALRLLMHDLMEFDILQHASSMAFTCITSLVPVLAAVFSVFTLFKPLMGEDGSIINYARGLILQNLTTGAGEAAIKHLESFIDGTDITKVGMTGGIASFVLLISLLRQVEVMFNKIWAVEKDRNFLMRFVYFWTFLTLGLFMTSVAISFLTKFSIPTGIAAQTGGIFNRAAFGWLMSLSFKVLFCFLLYKIVPNCYVSVKEAAVGAVVSGALFHLAVSLYGYYVADVANYKTLYGAFAAVPIFLFWIYIIWIILILGALIGRRIRLGMVSEASTEAEMFGNGPTAAIKAARFRSLLPITSLITVHIEYGKGTGGGLTALDLAGRLHVPESWIEEAFDLLMTLGFIVECTGPAVGIRKEGPSYMPSKPAAAIDLAELQRALTPTLDQWTEAWQSPMMREVQSVIMAMVKNVAKQGSRATLASVLPS